MILKIVQWPSSTLRQVSNEVMAEDIPLFNPFVNDLIETMYKSTPPGVGLSAIQVENNIRLFVADISLGPEVYFNPVIDDLSGDPVSLEEGCLSVPDFYANIPRRTGVKGYAFNREGVRVNFEDMPGTDVQKAYRAHVIQHEVEHLDGQIFLDHLSQSKREQARQFMKKRK